MIPKAHPRLITVARVIDHMGMGGIQRSIHSYLLHHNRTKFRVLLLRLQEKPTWEAWRDDPLIQQSVLLPVRHARDTKGIRRLAAFLREQSVDVLHSHGPFPNTIARQAAMLAGTPVVLPQYHSTYENRFDAEKLAWERVLWPYSSRALMVSTAALDAWRAHTGIRDDRQSVVWVPINLDAVEESSHRPTERLLEQINSFHPEWPLLCSASRLYEHKRIDEMIRSIGLLRDRRRGVRLFIAGDGPEENHLRALVKEVGVQDRVLMLGTIPDVPALLARSQASLLASDEEGFSQLNIEAMHCGVPVISTPVGVVASIDPRGEYVYVIPNSAAHHLAEAIERVLDHAPDRQQRIAQGKQMAQQFDAAQWSRNIESLYEQELERGFLKQNRPWGYGNKLSAMRFLRDRIQWRLLRRK